MDWDLSTIWSSLTTWLSSLSDDLKQAAIDGIGYALAQIPVPDFISQMGDFFGEIPPDVMFYLEPLHLGQGLQMMLAAFISGQVIRFIVGVVT
jgi:hypothetical protein